MWVPKDDYAVQGAASFLLAGEHSLRQVACLGMMWRSPCRWAPRACDVEMLMQFAMTMMCCTAAVCSSRAVSVPYT